MVKLDAHYVDPRLVILYDTDNPRGIDTDFWLSLADEVDAKRILDLGCGTGILTRELATEGRQVTGIDPAPAMLAIARQNDTENKVEWIEGDASALGTPDADLLFMTGNVAQVFLDDNEWQNTLTAIHAALGSGGYLAFESRNPERRAWEQWNRDNTYEKIDSPNGAMEAWLDIVDVSDGRVHLLGHNVFLSTGEDVVVDSILRFRSHQEMTESLTSAGFTVEHVYGDWKKTPFTNTSPLMVFVARRDK